MTEGEIPPITVDYTTSVSTVGIQECIGTIRFIAGTGKYTSYRYTCMACMLASYSIIIHIIMQREIKMCDVYSEVDN